VLVDPTERAGPKIVMFVRNDATRDVRVHREAASLTAAGFRVTIVALRTSALPEHETVGGVQILRVAAPSAWRRHWQEARYHPWRVRGWVISLVRAELRRGRAGWLGAGGIVAVSVGAIPFVCWRSVEYAVSRRHRPVVRAGDDVWDWLVRWHGSILGWARLAARAAPIADIWVGHDLNALPAAVRAQRQRGGRLVYDSHELFLDAGTAARRPRWARRIIGRLEGGWARAADAVVTVNESIAAEIWQRYRAGPTVVIRNCPPRWTTTEPVDHPLRNAIGVGPGTPVVLYHGGFQADRGLDQLADAILEPGLEGAHLVFMGFGPGQAHLQERAADPHAGGRIHVLPAVSPDELLDWVADADVGAMPNQPVTLNERYSTPNKLFECLAAGTPVVSSDTPERRAIVLDDPFGPLGRVCDPTDVRSLAGAIRGLLEAPVAERAELRARCLAASRDHMNWEIEAERLVALYTRLAPLANGAGA
jgi:glycosyltransferase involved in cell wall biosynthesis